MPQVPQEINKTVKKTRDLANLRLPNAWKEGLELPPASNFSRLKSYSHSIPIRDLPNASYTRFIPNIIKPGLPVTVEAETLLKSGAISIHFEQSHTKDEIQSAQFRIHLANPRSANSAAIPVGPVINITNLQLGSAEKNLKEIVGPLINKIAESKVLEIRDENGNPVLNLDPIQDERIIRELNKDISLIHHEQIKSSKEGFIDTYYLRDSSGNFSNKIFYSTLSPSAPSRLSKALQSEISVLQGGKPSAFYVPNPASANRNWNLILETSLGDFYCGKMAYIIGEQAEYNKKSAIVRNVMNEPLTAFVHVPADEYTRSLKTQKSTQEVLQRHKETIELLGYGLRGYAEDFQNSKQSLNRNFTCFVLGFEEFNVVGDNGTGEVASSSDVLKEICSTAFSDYTEIKFNRKKDTVSHPNAAVQMVATHKNGNQLKVNLLGFSFSVESSSIDNSQKSIQKALETFNPHAVIGMGSKVTSEKDSSVSKTYAVPNHVYNVDIYNKMAVEESMLPDNFSFSRAVAKGDAILNNLSDIKYND